MENIFVFKPKSSFENIGFIEGYSTNTNGNLIFYITNFTAESTNNCIGFCSENTPQQVRANFMQESQWMHINTIDGSIKLFNVGSKNYTVTCIHYDYDTFKNTEVMEFKCYGEYFATLIRLTKIDDDCKDVTSKYPFKNMLRIFICSLIIAFNIILKYSESYIYVLQNSATLTHLAKDMNIIRWMLSNVVSEGKVTIKVTNTLIARMLDFSLGLIMLLCFIKYKEDLFVLIQESMEFVIQSLKQLLTILMGSPAGLKLNYAFNKTLGTFFFYHIFLWRTFIQAISPMLKCTLNLIVVPGVLGLSYQIALFSDIVAFTTFHVYCIYVYAARLYGLQIKALTSLWRLFIGRKYNPLRDRVDSCQYTHHQLFVGTLGFAILLFLLPTTLLYYAVFTIFRVGLVMLDSILSNVRFGLQLIPLYITVLWILNSSKISGVVCLEISEKFQPPLSLEAKLKILPLWSSFRQFLPDCLAPVSKVGWRNLFHSIVTGKLI